MGENLVMNMNRRASPSRCITARRRRWISLWKAARTGITSLAAIAGRAQRCFECAAQGDAHGQGGQAVDEYIEKLLAILEPGDVIIDGGNSHFPDTIRRTALVESKDLLYVGTGVSGGEEGALKGPSMMPGGSPKAWRRQAHLQAICAKVEGGVPAATGRRKRAGTSSRWCTTALNTEICSSSAKRTSCLRTCWGSRGRDERNLCRLEQG